ncbi:MAG TPA: SDR family oxidoreductase [Pseudonocardiaceae bacterium]|jgi:NAD(P)-dependent dehydrogenase (short-subunit alcohol dehydrogenase family)|nr:SDR family oxidoreductase [Pseudonocardiaceae bacterium]
MSKALDGRTAIVYGAAGGLGTGITTAFAAAGAHVFLVGRTKETLDALAAAITSAGGKADTAVLDALDEDAVAAHAATVVAETGGLDISLNLITRGDVQGVPLIDMSADDLLRAVDTGLRGNFITAKAAARHMVERGSGVIIALNSGSAHGSPMMGSTGPADAALDILVRNLAQEIGPRGVRVAGIWAAGVLETLSPEKLGMVNDSLGNEAAFQGIIDQLDKMRMLRRSPSLAQIADATVFLASDAAGALTGTWLNATATFTS